MTQDVIDLAAAGWTARLLPAQGGAMAELAWHDTPVLVPLPAGADPNGSFAGAFLMLPWANRLDGGRLPVLGSLHRAGPVNRPEEETAIHGLARDLPWQVAEASPLQAVLTQEYDGAEQALPWRWRARLAVALGPAGAEIVLAVENAGDAPFPFGFGWHPFFRRPTGTRLHLRATMRLTRDARRLPVAAEPTDGIHGAEEAYEGLDTHYAGWDGAATIARPDLLLTLAAEGAWARNLQVFAPAGGDVLCVEPVSHVPDAPNRPDLAPLGPMTLLAPGESLVGRLVLRATDPTPR